MSSIMTSADAAICRERSRLPLLCMMVGGSLAINGLIAHFLQPDIKTWYRSLDKIDLVPPDPIFAAVWATLFAVMAIALWFYCAPENKSRQGWQQGLAIFWGQYALCCIWPICFFGLHSVLLGMLGTLLLWPLIALTLRSFYRIDRVAGLLLLPYQIWVTVAIILSISLYLFNTP